MWHILPRVSKLADNVDVAQTDDQIGNQDHEAKDHRPDNISAPTMFPTCELRQWLCKCQNLSPTPWAAARTQVSTGPEPPQVGQVSEGHKNHDDSDDDFDSHKDNDNCDDDGKRILIKARPINGLYFQISMRF